MLYTTSAMKIKNWLKLLFSGMAIGFGSAVPGVSGGTIAVILGVYKKIIWSISNILKSFKGALRVLLPTLLGVVIALVPTIFLMNVAIEYFIFGIICVFAGFILGSIPGIIDEVKEVKINYKHIIALAICLLIAVGLGIASVKAEADVTYYFYNTPTWFYFVLIPVGFVGSIALVVPGLSGGMLLLLMGFYTPLIQYTTGTLHDCVHGDWSAFGSLVGILGCFAIGVIIGFYLVSKLMHFLLARFHDVTFYGIIGFVVGSLIALFYNNDIYSKGYKMWADNSYKGLPYYIEIPVGIGLLIIACVLSYLLVRYKRKQDQIEKEIPEE